jgi:protein TonB
MFAEDVETPKPPLADVAKAVIDPPKLPEPPKSDPPPSETPVARPTPQMESLPETKLDIPFSPTIDFMPVGGGVSVRPSTGIFLPETPYSLVDLDRHPEPLHRTAPEYPYEMKRAGINGWARIEFIVEVDGTISHARVESASNREFGEAGLRAVRNWRFTPGMKDNIPVRSWMMQPFDFNADR